MKTGYEPEYFDEDEVTISVTITKGEYRVLQDWDIIPATCGPSVEERAAYILHYETGGIIADA
ncbi:hypothetical protein [Phenylobacterium sp.]|jgi:hypothetical protein|uniref:hypothetical protein n=1 Tax=Phenylobacterium sp. TaxID=1871053 RepID=UPI002F4090D2